MLTANEIAAMRSTVNASQPDTITIERLTIASDGAGGSTRTWNDHATVPAIVSPADTQGSDPELGARAANVVSWTITVPAGTDVTTADRARYGTRRFEIRSVSAGRSYELSVRLGCIEVA